MGHKVQKNERASKSQWLGAALLLFAFTIIIWVLFIQGEQKTEMSSVSPVHRESEVERANFNTINRINQNLKSADIKGELKKKEVELESSGAGQIDDTNGYSDLNRQEPIPLSFEQENSAKRVLSDTNGKTRRAGRPLTPDQRISAKVQNEAWLREEEKRREKEYVKQFIENAREQGVDVQLNENLEVIGVDPVDEPEPLRFPQSVSPPSR